MNWDAFFGGEPPQSVPGLIEVFIGSGDDVLDLASGLPIAVVSANHRGGSNFVLEAVYDDGSTDLLVNEIGRYQGKTLAAHSGASLIGIDVTAGDDWAILASNVLLAVTGDDVARTYEGVGDTVIVFPTINDEPRESVSEFSRVTLTHDGESNFVVRELLASLLVNEIGSYSGTVRISAEGLFGLEIIADGAWTVTFE